MEHCSITIQFPDVTPDRGNRYAEGLQGVLKGSLGANDRIERRRTTPESQDLGSTLVLVLGTAAVTAVAEGIKIWLAKTRATIEIVTPNGSWRASNLDSKSVEEIVKAVSNLHRK